MEDTNDADDMEDADDADDTDNVGARDSEHNAQDLELDPFSKVQNADCASKPAPEATSRANRINHSQSPPSG